MSRRELLAHSMDESFGRLQKRLRGLDDAELFWEPLAGCWTVRRTASGRWTYDYAIPSPDPAPLTTIAWQLVHLGTTKLMYHEWAYGPARLTFPEIDIPSDTAGVLALLEQGQQLLRDDLEQAGEAGLDEPRKTNWGDLWPAWRIFWTMIDHDALHGGIVGTLRDLYQWRQAP